VNWIGALLDQKVVPPVFAAAMLGADVETPIFSDALTKAVIADGREPGAGRS
jgi:hypothetical protein